MRIFALKKLLKHTKTTNSMHNIGQKVKELREKRNYTQEYMAEQLGITQGSYSKIEQNKSNPPISRLLKIAAILEINTDEYSELVGTNERTVFTNNNYKKQQNGIVVGGISQSEKDLYEKLIATQQKTIELQEQQLAMLQKENETSKLLIEQLQTSLPTI